MARRIKGILFDLGDTLLDFGKVDVLNLFEAGARLSYDYLEQLNQPLPPFEKYHRKQLWAIRWNYFKSRIINREFNALDVIGRVSESMGHSLAHRDKVELAWLWYEPLSKCATVEDGTSEMLQKFLSDGLSLGLVSNTFVPSEVLDRHLAKVGLLELLPVRVYSCEVSHRKPDRRIFEAALIAAGLEATETMFVGDSPVADIKGAAKAGMISVLKDPLGRFATPKIKPTHRIASLTELPGVLGRYDISVPDSTAP